MEDWLKHLLIAAAILAVILLSYYMWRKTHTKCTSKYSQVTQDLSKSAMALNNWWQQLLKANNITPSSEPLTEDLAGLMSTCDWGIKYLDDYGIIAVYEVIEKLINKFMKDSNNTSSPGIHLALNGTNQQNYVNLIGEVFRAASALDQAFKQCKSLYSY
jgi:hypothetical protein